MESQNGLGLLDRRRRKTCRFQVDVGLIQMLTDLSRFEDPQAVGRSRRHCSAPVRSVAERFHQMKEQPLHVALVFHRLNSQLFATRRCFRWQ